MAKEIWLWILEKLQAAAFWMGGLFTKLWRWFTGKLVMVSGSTWRKIVAFVPIILVFYILIGMIVANRIDDDLELNISTPRGGSKAVAAVTFLVEREAKHHNWTPNDPIFMPGWWIDNTPNFQKGIIGALSRFGFELRDQLGRRRGSSAVDEALEQAAGNLAKEPDRWVMDLSMSLLPTTASDAYFREAAKGLKDYNDRLELGSAIFERRTDNLLATLDRISLDLGASSAALEEYIGKNAGGILPDYQADDLFYQTKGQVYAYTVILQALKEDFSKIITDRELTKLFDDLLQSLTDAASLDPVVVFNGAADGIWANHLSMQGFYLLRARTQLKEVANILLK